jgi:hypothetical protein
MRAVRSRLILPDSARSSRPSLTDGPIPLVCTLRAESPNFWPKKRTRPSPRSWLCDVTNSTFSVQEQLLFIPLFVDSTMPVAASNLALW